MAPRAGAGLVALAVLALLVPLAVVVVAGANHTAQRDPNDTRGRLDLRAVRLDTSSTPEWTFVSFQPWRISRIWDAGFFMVELDTRDDDAVDRVIVVRSDGRRLVARVFRVLKSGAQVEIDRATARKAGPRGVSVTVAFHKLDIGRSRSSYFWATLSSFTGSACPRTCLDRVPDQGMIEQLLPGAPSPTPTMAVDDAF